MIIGTVRRVKTSSLWVSWSTVRGRGVLISRRRVGRASGSMENQIAQQMTRYEKVRDFESKMMIYHIQQTEKNRKDLVS